MLDRSLLKRITSNPEIFGGKPIIPGLRISVELVLSLLVQRVRTEELLDEAMDIIAEVFHDE